MFLIIYPLISRPKRWGRVGLTGWVCTQKYAVSVTEDKSVPLSHRLNSNSCVWLYATPTTTSSFWCLQSQFLSGRPTFFGPSRWRRTNPVLASLVKMHGGASLEQQPGRWCGLVYMQCGIHTMYGVHGRFQFPHAFKTKPVKVRVEMRPNVLKRVKIVQCLPETPEKRSG